MIGRNETHDDAIIDAVQVLERRDLDFSNAANVSCLEDSCGHSPLKDRFHFVRIKAISRTLPAKKTDVERYLMEDVLSGLHGLKNPFIYLIIGTSSSVGVYIGILNRSTPELSSASCTDTLISSMHSTFPDIEMALLSEDEVDKKIFKFFKKLSFFWSDDRGANSEIRCRSRRNRAD